VDTLLQALRNLGPLRLTVMGGVAMALIGFFIFLTTRLTSPQLELLYGGLESDDVSQIMTELATTNTPYELRGGNQVFVPSDKVSQVRLSMASKGIPSGGSIGYEIFDEASSLGTTNFIQNINLLRALEGELSRTIKDISSVKSARVHLVLPKRELFSRQAQQPSASIVLNMSGGMRLGAEQVSAVQHLVAAAVPGLNPNRISIVDNKGSLLARGFEEEGTPGAMSAKGEERKLAMEKRLSQTIEQLLEKTVGFGKVRAEVNADMDFDLITTNEELYDPEGQVVRSTQSVEQGASSEESDGATPVSVATNLPDANLGSSTSSASLNTKENRTEETVNYANSKKSISHTREAGVVTRLSVAVLLDGTYSEDENGDKVYQPRNEAEMELMATLVRSAIGFSADRGDSVDVINMQFADLDTGVEEELELFFGLDKNDLLRMAEILVLSIVAILVILLVVRPLVSRAFEALPAAMAEGKMLADQTTAAATAALTAPSAGAPAPSDAPGIEDQYDELIDIDRVEGRVKASSVKKVGEIVAKHPEEALSIVRSWMYQEG
jgi:flagellar M-ring protein FliF